MVWDINERLRKRRRKDIIMKKGERGPSKDYELCVRMLVCNCFWATTVSEIRTSLQISLPGFLFTWPTQALAPFAGISSHQDRVYVRRYPSVRGHLSKFIKQYLIIPGQ